MQVLHGYIATKSKIFQVPRTVRVNSSANNFESISPGRYYKHDPELTRSLHQQGGDMRESTGPDLSELVAQVRRLEEKLEDKQAELSQVGITKI